MIKNSFLLMTTGFLFAAPAQARVLLGIDVLEKGGFKELQGRNVAVITNQTGLNSEGKSIVDLISRAKGVKLVAILSPEHGFRGEAEHGVKVESSSDPATGLPIFSLYGATTRPTDEMLAGADTIVFDMQDIGTRFYTYITTMGLSMEEAAARKLKFVVLDRPNPVRGDVIEGDVLDPDIRRMTGYFQIPVRHGFTVGELAKWFNDTQKLGLDLEIVKMRNWKRTMWFSDTKLTFTPPSPNIPSPLTALLYAGIGCFEATNVSVGRGTPTPFELIGAPWMNGKGLAAHLREQNFKGIIFEPVEFTPAKDVYVGQACQGVKFIVTDRNAVRPFDIFISAFLFLAHEHPEAFVPVWEEVRVVTGTNHLQQALAQSARQEDVIAHYQQRSAEFARSAAAFHLY